MKNVTLAAGAVAMMSTLALAGCPKSETPEPVQSPQAAAVATPIPSATGVTSATPSVAATASVAPTASPVHAEALMALTHPSSTPKAAAHPSAAPTPKHAATAPPHKAPTPSPMPKATPAATATPKPAPHANLGPAIDFTLKPAMGGQAVKLSDHSGKVRIVDFWATWCPPCRAEIPDFVALQKQYGTKGLQIIGVSVDRAGPEVVTKFMQENSMNYVSLMSESSVEQAYGGIRGIPTTFVIDRDGNIVKKYVGGQERATFEQDIKALL